MSEGKLLVCEEMEASLRYETTLACRWRSTNQYAEDRCCIARKISRHHGIGLCCCCCL